MLAKGCPGLMTFHCRGCILIGDDALTHLARFCSRLHTVNIQGCLVIRFYYQMSTLFHFDFIFLNTSTTFLGGD